MTKQRRAQYDGQIGANGEKYRKGEFISTSKDTIKGSTKSKKPSRKEEIAPYCWQVAPESGLRSIFTLISQHVKFQGATTYSKKEGKGGTLVLLEDLIIGLHDCGMWKGDVDESLAEQRELVQAWNDGSRWCSDDGWQEGKSWEIYEA